MALVACPDCGAHVSSAAPACPRCGRPFRATSAPKTSWLQDRNLGCLGACLVFLVLPAILMFTWCGR